jgi:hypothetical protein
VDYKLLCFESCLDNIGLEKIGHMTQVSQKAIPRKPVEPEQPATVSIEVQTETVSTCTVGTDAAPLAPPHFGIHCIKSDQDCRDVCGVPLWFFKMTVHQLKDTITDGRVIKATNKIVMYFFKLKCNVPFSILCHFFGVSRSAAGSIFHDVLAAHYKIAQDYTWWLPRKIVQATMPQCFKKSYSTTRVIIDASEVKIASPSTVRANVLFYSAYKAGFTVKYLVGISPSGQITFISKNYGGRATDAIITTESGLMKLLEPGDVIMADKGFPLIQIDAEQRKTFILMPPFKHGSTQFSDKENKEGYKIASVRIHVERAIARMKTFQILKHLESNLYPLTDQITLCIAYIVNHFPPLIAEK